MVERLCKRLGHLSTDGTVSVSLNKGKLIVYDICGICKGYFYREPTAEERKEYSKLLIDDYSVNLKL